MNADSTLQRSLPTCLDDLRRCADQERTGKGRRMGERTLAVLVDLLERPAQAAVRSISELAAHNRVDPSTLTRLGKRLGFSGFAPLQEIFRQHIAATQPFYSTRVHELVAGHSGGRAGMPQRLAESECQKVLAVASALTDAQLARAARQLLEARHVYVLGLRGTYALSYFFGSFLETLREGVTIMGGPGFPLAAEIARIKRDDLLVAVAFRPYTRAVVNAVKIVRKAGTPVLSLTDGGSAVEVEPQSGVTLEADQPFYFDSALAQFYVAEAVLLAVARDLGPAATEVIRRRESINKALDIEIH
jgi:DNA-binding MurR/RpiR family transcriptional regulator